MIRFLILLLLSTQLFANPYEFKVLRIIDGDTVEFQADFLPKPLKPKMSIRVLGVDTPEKGHRAKCDVEAEAAKKASAFTTQKINNAEKVEILIKKHDKYGGRLLGDVIIDGDKLSELLIENGHGIEYHGGKKENPWCD
jgi:micrococcal nuclease